MINGRYVALINGEPIVFVIISQATEPAVPAGKVRVWHESGTGKRWLVQGTDGTVGGNKKVEIS